MYTKEDAEGHKRAMEAISADMKRPRTWAEFKKLQKEIESVSAKNFDQASQNMQSDWESVFIHSLHGIEFKLVMVINNGVTKQLKKTAARAMMRLTKILDDLIQERTLADLAKKEFILTPARQRNLIGKIKKIFDEESCKKRRAR